jgi:glutathione S-transferase
MKLILHNYRRCPFCIRTRILLYLKGFEYEIIEEPLRVWTPWMKEWSERTGERARVPVLRYVLEEEVEKVMPESNEMNLFVDSVDGNPKYTPQRESPAYREMQNWWNWCDNELKPMIDLYKYGLNLKFDPVIHPLHSAELQKLVLKLESHLMAHAYLVQERMTLADIAIIPFIRQIMRTREGEFDFRPYPRVLEWTNNVIETNWFKDVVMKKV